MDCIFCAIAAHRAPAEIVYEDAQTMAFVDINPAAEGHTLIIPKRHATDIFELTDDDAAAVMRSAVRVAQAVRAALQPDGVNLVQNNGRAAGQLVPHVHIHIVPRRAHDGVVTFPHGRTRGEPSGLRATAEKIREKIT